MQEHLTVTYVDEAGIKIEVDIDVSGFTLENSPGGGSIKWRNQGAGSTPTTTAPGGGFLSKLMSDGFAAAARPTPRERPRRYRPAVTATTTEETSAVDDQEGDDAAAAVEDSPAGPGSV